jgi:hypothetical protein
MHDLYVPSGGSRGRGASPGYRFRRAHGTGKARRGAWRHEPKRSTRDTPWRLATPAIVSISSWEIMVVFQAIVAARQAQGTSRPCDAILSVPRTRSEFSTEARIADTRPPRKLRVGHGSAGTPVSFPSAAGTGLRVTEHRITVQTSRAAPKALTSDEILHSVRIDGPDTPGVGAEITKALSVQRRDQRCPAPLAWCGHDLQ